MRCIENAYLTAVADGRRIGDTFENAMSFVTMACEPGRIEEHGDNVGFRAEQEAMTMLATASVLMYALDRAEKRIPPEPA
jgi:hypothetical protein